MSMRGVLSILFAVCLAQALFLAPVLANLKTTNRRATRILAALMVCFLPMIGEEWIGAAGLTVQFPNSIASSMTVDFLLAPLLFFYARALTERDRAFARTDLLHFITFLLALVVLFPFYRLSGDDKLLLLDNQQPLSFTIVVIAKIVMAAVYLPLIIRRLHTYVRKTDTRSRDPHAVWLLRIMIGMVCVVVAMIVVGELPGLGSWFPVDSDDVGMLSMCGSIYLISFLLIRHPLSPVLAGAAPPVVPHQFRPKYETSPLTGRAKEEYHARLVRYMDEQKPHLDMGLCLEKLAGALDIRPAYLSQVLNERLGFNFYEFVNEYRVREAQSRIADPAHSEKTLLAIAHESGFNSKASCNRAFKRVTGQTPSDYARARLAPHSEAFESSQSIE